MTPSYQEDQQEFLMYPQMFFKVLDGDRGSNFPKILIEVKFLCFKGEPNTTKHVIYDIIFTNFNDSCK